MDGRDQMNDQQAQRRKATSGLLQAASLWRRLAERALLAEGISAARADVLIWIGRLGGGLRQVQLAEAIGHTSNALVRLLDELSASDLIERRPDESDRRANRIWLTPQGEELAARAEDVLNVLRDEVLGDMGSDDLAAAVRLYETIAEAANGQAEARNASLLAS
ncbi:MarR family winged helix-turn-helix transcriptional regulator [Neorhizobium alkalisoli]|uniref:MarR family transcriptional regulator n=1 Tax=Neorhizobium alkalisoli TaxID=528178 RepID=A0A561QGP3_9HYPH|nr:MarR family transcriptional regulator [Neorhizobium alkalisoli]TWF49461.1 MarR family transcriptional regulator [Neorhizobium alkalisoli]